jgi:diaminopimelate decarboxylase
LVLAEELFRIYGSPLYVYQGDKLRQTIDRITNSISYSGTKFHFACVTNGNIVGVDTTVANLSVPTVHGGYRKIVFWKNSNNNLYCSDVCGNTTYS